MQVYSLFFIIVSFWIVFGVGSQRTVTETSNVTEERPVEMEMLGVVRRLRRLGVAARGHAVRAADGTTLRVVRAGRPAAAPVLLAHGLLQAATSWFDAGPASLVTLLAPNYDLWLLNARGSTLSRPPPNPEHWRFSVDDMGRYDLPAFIDYILSYTGKTQLAYVGFSEGATSFFIMCSERPEYCDKVNLMVALAPATKLNGMKSNLKIAFDYFEKTENELNKYGIYEVMPKGSLLFNLQLKLCIASLNICERIKELYDYPHPGSIEPTTFLTTASGFPSGSSVRNMARYSQHLRSKNFQKYDFGPEQNLLHYGSKTAPIYNLSAVTVPTVIIYSKNDPMIDVSNIKWQVERLPNVVEAFEMKDPMWTHMDFTMSRNIPRYLHPTVKKYLERYS